MTQKIKEETRKSLTITLDEELIKALKERSKKKRLSVSRFLEIEMVKVLRL